MKSLKIIYKGVKALRGEDSLYKKIYNYLPLTSGESREVKCRQIVIKKDSNPELRKIFRGIEKIKFVDVYVHGSWADDTKTPFSDLDDLVIIDREKLVGKPKQIRKIVRWLAKVELRLYQKDVLQHHGHWIIFRDWLENMDESYIPINVIRNAVLIKGNSVVQYNIDADKTRLGLKWNVEITLQNIERLMSEYWSGKINIYKMKALIGSFLLMPAYIFQIRGTEISKRDAIENKNKIFSSDVCKLLDKCSMIRLEWGKVLKCYRLYLLKIAVLISPHPFIFKYINKRISPKFPINRFPILTRGEVELFKKEIEQLCQ